MKGPVAGANIALNGAEIDAKTANGAVKVDKPSKEVVLLANPYGKIEEALEKKLRNLEKRRQKQQQLKQELETGKALSEEQKEAISMLNEVERQIEWIKEVQKTTQQQGRQFQRATKLRDEAERKKEVDGADEYVKSVVQFRELLKLLKKEDVEGGEWDVLEQVRGLLQPAEDFNSFGEFNSHLGKNSKKVLAIVKGTEEVVLSGFTGAAVKALLEKIASADFVQDLRFNNLEVKTETNIAAQTQEPEPVESEIVESPASPSSLSSASSQRTDISRSQDSSEVPRQSPEPKRSSETPEEKVVFVANDSAQTNGTCEGQFVFAAEPVNGSVVVPVMVPGPNPVMFVPVMTVPAPPPVAVPPEMVANVPSTFVPAANDKPNGNQAPKNYRHRNGPRGPRPGQQVYRPYRQQNSHDSNSDSSNGATEFRQNAQRNFRSNGNNNSNRPNGGGYRGNRNQPRDNPAPKPKYQYGFRFAETPAN